MKEQEFIEYSKNRLTSEYPTLSQEQGRAIVELAISKYEVVDHEDRQSAHGFIEGYAQCMVENGFKNKDEVAVLIYDAGEVLKFLNRGEGINPGSAVHVNLKNSVLKIRPPYFTFPPKLEVALDHLIKYCRKLEKDIPGTGYNVLNEIAPATEIFDAVQACLKFPDAKYEFTIVKYCGAPECRDTEFASGYCKKHLPY
jgi:hypothetical protein